MTYLGSSTIDSDAQNQEMSFFQADTHVFVIRCWLEAREIEGTQQIWRGVIEHVTSRKRRFLKKPEEILSFLKQYQGEFEVQESSVQTPHDLLKEWLSRVFRK